MGPETPISADGPARASVSDTHVAALGIDPVVREARDRWNRASEWTNQFRARFLEDIKFCNGDSDNGFQWPNAIRQSREIDSRPCLTMNMVRQHNKIIANQARKNKKAVKFLGAGNGATQDAANVYQDIMRRIEYQSNAQHGAYKIGQGFQIDGGLGYWRLVTRYTSNRTMDQDIFIEPIIDPLMVYSDPDAQLPDETDANWKLVFDMVPKAEFENSYPKFKGARNLDPLGIGTVSDTWWGDSENVWVVEYFRKIVEEDELISFVHMNERKYVLKSKLPKDVLAGILNDPMTRSRDVAETKIEWRLIVGEQVIDETTWPGKYIPIIPVKGEETRIEGVIDYKGHTRFMKDAQRMYNYNASAQVEAVALQGKTPWMGAAESIREVEQIWNTANRTNHSFLPFNHLDSEGNPLPPQSLPSRVEPAKSVPAYQEGMDTAFNQMMATSGQWQNQMGMGGNERTGAAISERQAQSDTAVYHFEDNYEAALINTGRQVLDLIPKIYDTERMLQMLADDGDEYELVINPAARQAYAQEQDHTGRVIRRIVNPNLGEYDVIPTAGPDYATRMSESNDYLTRIIGQAPGIMGIIGDLVLSTMPFAEAKEAGLRLKRLAPPQALGQGPTPNEQKLQAQVQELTTQLVKALEGHAKDKLKLTGKDQMRDIDVYEAETKRFSALTDVLPLDPTGMKAVIDQLVKDSMDTHLQPILEANAPGLRQKAAEGSAGAGSVPGPPEGEAHPVPGAQKSEHDGEWYVLDPTRKGKYLRISALAHEGSRNG